MGYYLTTLHLSRDKFDIVRCYLFQREALPMCVYVLCPDKPVQCPRWPPPERCAEHSALWRLVAERLPHEYSKSWWWQSPLFLVCQKMLFNLLCNLWHNSQSKPNFYIKLNIVLHVTIFIKNYH